MGGHCIFEISEIGQASVLEHQPGLAEQAQGIRVVRHHDQAGALCLGLESLPTAHAKVRVTNADDLIDQTNRSTISSSVVNQGNILPSIPVRNVANNNRLNRRIQHPTTITIPRLTNSSLEYLNNLNSVGKVYSDNKKISVDNRSKLYFIDGQQKKRYLKCYCLFFFFFFFSS